MTEATSARAGPRIFAPTDAPRVFGLPPGVDFSRALIAGLAARLDGHPPEAMARVEIWVNTERARRNLIAELASGPPRLLPRIRTLADLAQDTRLPRALPAPVPDLRRALELARLIARLIAADPGLAPETAAFDLAESLADLMDEMQGEGVDPAALSRIDAEDHAAHWQRSLRFLDILTGYLARAGTTDAQGRLRHAAEALGALWSAAPAAHPIIVAGSTGSRGATRRFMAAVARLPQGALVLPGYDADLPPAVWERLGSGEAGAADHPQFGFRQLADALGFAPGDVARWHDTAAPAPARNALVSLAMRPAPVTDQWRAEGARLVPTLDRAVTGLTWVEADGAREEARAVALALRRAAGSGIRAALVTPDRVLARRVKGELGRWGLIPDDSAGRPLALTPPGVFLRCLAQLMGAQLTPEALLVLLKHPLTASSPDQRGAHLCLARRIEMDILRGGSPVVKIEALHRWAAQQTEGAAARDWTDWIARSLAPLLAAGPAPLGARVALHRTAAEALAAGPEGGAHRLWDREAGQQALALMTALAGEAETFGAIRAPEYRALLRNLMAARDVPEEAVVTHGSIAIWGTLEARVQSADLVILGGLNDGIWPRLPDADPWLSRTMRTSLGLPSPERRIGLSAHDFQQAAGAAQVMLTRATRDAEAPTVAARWLLRLENLLGGLEPQGAAALATARGRGQALLADAAAIDRPQTRVPPARRPAPRPPRSARPTALSVTQIEKLVRDPYAIYARKVLRLRPLDPPGMVADPRLRGMVLHAVLEAFLDALEVHALGADPAQDPSAVFARTADAVLARMVPWPAMRAIWRARLDRAAAWIIAGEAERRLRGIPRAREIRGRRSIAALPAPFAVTAEADRIDMAPDGYAIYDYKSGSLPSAKQANLFDLQLWLEAAIAEAGGFEGLPPAPVRHLELIGIAEQKILALDTTSARIAEIWTRLSRLIAAYQDAATGFTARLRPYRIVFSGDYDHLSRLGEWADGDPPDPQVWT